MQSFDYVAAQSLSEAATWLAQDGNSIRILAGGTDLIVQLREGRRQARLVLDIKAIPELNELAYEPMRGAQIGAAVPCYKICQDRRIATAYPGIIDAVSLIGGTQIQGRATVGGNLCNASPAADTIPALIVHRATCVIFGPRGYREVPVETFCSAPGRTILAVGEFLVALRLPPPEPGFGAHYQRFIPRNEMDIAVAGAGAAVVLDHDRARFVSARIALSAVAPVPLFVPQAGEWLAGREISDETMRQAAEIAREAAQPIDDMRGTAVQRKHLAGVLTRRALEKAVARARGQEA